MLALFLAVAVATGPQADRPKSANAVEVKGTIYRDNIAIEGTIYKTGPELDSTQAACTAFEDAACFQACDNEIQNPFCTVVNANCMQTGGGGISCSCWFFCATPKGGQHCRPDEACVFPRISVVGDTALNGD